MLTFLTMTDPLTKELLDLPFPGSRPFDIESRVVPGMWYRVRVAPGPTLTIEVGRKSQTCQPDFIREASCSYVDGRWEVQNHWTGLLTAALYTEQRWRPDDVLTGVMRVSALCVTGHLSHFAVPTRKDGAVRSRAI